jgi:hypothetical protein
VSNTADTQIAIPYTGRCPNGEFLTGTYRHAWSVLRPVEFIKFARANAPARPVLSPAAHRLFQDMTRYARHFSRRLADLPAVASDCIDGAYHANSPAVVQLVRAGVISCAASDDAEPMWELTPYGCAVLVAYSPVPLPEEDADAP